MADEFDLNAEDDFADMGDEFDEFEVGDENAVAGLSKMGDEFKEFDVGVENAAVGPSKMWFACAPSVSFPFITSLPDRVAEDVVAGPSKRVEPGSDEEDVAGPSSKRVKLTDGESCEPTCVLSLRGLPGDITEAEVVKLATTFGGPVSNVILTRNKFKALLEMADLASAQKIFDRFNKFPMQVRSCQVFVNYSKHAQLKLKVGEESVSMDRTRCVLHIIIDNMIFPVTLALLSEVFSRYGEITKIVTFNHKESFHALIQYADGVCAYNGKQALNGQNLFQGCCKLYIEYSKLKDLVVRYNSDISRDYKNADLPWNDTPSFVTATPHDKQADDKVEQEAPADGAAPTRKALLPTPRMPYRDPRLVEPTAAMPSMFLPPSTPTMEVIINPFYAERKAVPSAPTIPDSKTLPKKVPWAERRPVVLVSNLDETRVTTDSLFTLFGVYGDVIRVKVCCNTKSKALIQYKDYKYARDAVMNLDGVNLWGRQLKLTISKYRIVQMPKPGAHNADLTVDYTTSRWHRFHNGDRAEAPIVAPSKTLFLANIPPKVTETKLKRMFNACGTVVDFKFFEPSNLFLLQKAVQISQLPPNSDRTKERILNQTPDRRMALIQMNTVEEGVDALMNLHNKQFPGTNRYLCVSFTTSVIDHHNNSHP